LDRQTTLPNLAHNSPGLDPLDLTEAGLNYSVIAQSAEDLQDMQNAPAISMGPYLIQSDQVKLLTTISIYSQRGESRDQVRLLYMNTVALRLWEAMGNKPRIVAALHRPPKTALLNFGVPFSE
jgi:hypothetical protein